MAMFGQPKGDIILIRYHIRERKCGLIASNIAQAGLMGVGFCTAKIRNQRKCRGQQQESKIGVYSVISTCDGHQRRLWARPELNQGSHAQCHIASLRGSQIGLE